MINFKLSLLAVSVLLSMNALAGSSPDMSVYVRVQQAGWISCHHPSEIKTLLKVTVENRSAKPMALGQIYVVQERVYTRMPKGRLQLLRTTDTPDDFAPLDATGNQGLSGVPDDEVLSKHASKTVVLEHYIFLGPSDLQAEKKNFNFAVSFHITNVHRDGAAQGYWSDPLGIALPRTCRGKSF